MPAALGVPIPNMKGGVMALRTKDSRHTRRERGTPWEKPELDSPYRERVAKERAAKPASKSTKKTAK